MTSTDLRQDEEKDDEEEEEEVQLPALNLFLQEENRKCIALKFPMLCPLVLLIKLGWRQSTELGNGEGKETGSGMLQYTKQEMAKVRKLVVECCSIQNRKWRR